MLTIWKKWINLAVSLISKHMFDAEFRIFYSYFIKNAENVLFASRGRITKCFLHKRRWIHLSYCTNHYLSSIVERVSLLQLLTCAQTSESAWCSTVKCPFSNSTQPSQSSVFLHHLTKTKTKQQSLKSSFRPRCSIQLTLCFRTVVKCNIAKSQALYSAQRGLKTNNAAVFKVGAIMINIPQHPATLHSMMVRSSHQLSKQISDLIRQPSTTCVHFLNPPFFFSI